MSENQKFPHRFVSSQFSLSISDKEIQGLRESLAHSISERYQGQELVVIGILKGCMTFMADLVREIKGVKIYVDFVKIKSLGRDKESNGTMSLQKDLSSNILDKNVLIIEEIIDTGRAVNFLKNRLMLSSPHSVEVVTLFDKPYKRAVPLKANFIGRKLEDQFVVGYGLDLEEYGRNLANLYVLKYPN